MRYASFQCGPLNQRFGQRRLSLSLLSPQWLHHLFLHFALLEFPAAAPSDSSHCEQDKAETKHPFDRPKICSPQQAPTFARRRNQARHWSHVTRHFP
jgi:hypothetical protein